MDVLPRDAELLRREAAAMPQDEAFPGFVAAARERRALVEVVSDGLGFYIESNLAALGVRDMAVAKNDNTVQNGGDGMSFPFSHPTCFVCGTCKRERVRLHHEAGGWSCSSATERATDTARRTPTLSSRKRAWRASVAPKGGRSSSGDSFVDVSAEVERAFADGRLPASAEDLRAGAPTFSHGPRPFICGPEVWGPGRTTPGPGPR